MTIIDRIKKAADGLTVFTPATWTCIHYHSVMNQYGRSAIPTIFDDAYFEALAKRRDEKRAFTTKMMSANVLLLMLLALTAFGVKPDYTFQGIKIEVDKLKELLLLLHTTGSFTIALLHNDLMVMRAMLRARAQQRIDQFEENQWPLLKDFAMQAYDMRYLDSFGDGTPAHIDSWEDNPPPGVRGRGVIVRKMVIWIGRLIILAMLTIQVAVLCDVATSPSFHWAVSWGVVALSVLTSLLWLALKIPYCVPKRGNFEDTTTAP